MCVCQRNEKLIELEKIKNISQGVILNNTLINFGDDRLTVR